MNKYDDKRHIFTDNNKNIFKVLFVIYNINDIAGFIIVAWVITMATIITFAVAVSEASLACCIIVGDMKRLLTIKLHSLHLLMSYRNPTLKVSIKFMSCKYCVNVNQLMKKKKNNISVIRHPHMKNHKIFINILIFFFMCKTRSLWSTFLTKGRRTPTLKSSGWLRQVVELSLGYRDKSQSLCSSVDCASLTKKGLEEIKRKTGFLFVP